MAGGAEGHDDVTEFTLKGTTTRELQRPGCVPVNLEEVDPSLGHPTHVRGIFLLVKLFIFLAGGKTLDELGPGLIGLAGKQYVAQAVEEGFIHGA